jgi:hypothetical protein
MPYIFERFYRVDQSRSRTSGGSGIGLTISRHLVWAMGGELTAVSDGPNQGSCFTFTLPLVQDCQLSGCLFDNHLHNGPAAGFRVKVAAQGVFDLFIQPLTMPGKLLHDLVNFCLGLLHQLFFVTPVDETARDDFRLAHHLGRCRSG